MAIKKLTARARAVNPAALPLPRSHNNDKRFVTPSPPEPGVRRSRLHCPSRLSNALTARNYFTRAGHAPAPAFHRNLRATEELGSSGQPLCYHLLARVTVWEPASR